MSPHPPLEAVLSVAQQAFGRSAPSIHIGSREAIADCFESDATVLV